MAASSSQTSVEGELSNHLDLFDSASSITEKVEHFTNITKTVLPGIQLCEIERTLFAKLLPKVHNVVLQTLDTVADLVKSLVQSQSDAVSSVQIQLQAILSILECIETCVNYAAHFTDEIFISHIHSLPLTAIKTIQSTFRHCKESTSLYGDVFHLLSDDLSLIFKRTYQLQKAVMDLVERVQLTFDATETEVVYMASICHEVLEICNLIGEMDTSLLVNTWKVLNRLVTKHKEHIKNHLDVDRIVIHLCLSVEAKFIQCVQLAPQLETTDNQVSQVNTSGDTKALNKMLKIVRFLMGHLMHLLKEFIDYIDKSYKQLLHLLMVLQRFPPFRTETANYCDAASKEAFSSVLVVVEPLLGILVTSKQFADTLTRFQVEEMESLHKAALCTTLTRIVAIMPLVTEDVFTYWVAPSNYPEDEPRISVVQALFKSLDHAFIELSLPVYVDGVMCKGKPHREVSFYDHVCTRLCTLVAVSPASCFERIENCLLENVLGDNLLPALMAMDVWCFIARWGSANLCYENITFLCELLLKLHSEGKRENVHLNLLIKRLLCLLAPKHQDNLVTTFSPSKVQNIPLWSLAPLQQLQNSLRKKVCCCTTPLCIKYCHGWANGDHSTTDAELLHCLSCLNNIYCSAPEVRDCVPPVHHVGVVNLVNSLWTKVRQNEKRGLSEKICSQLIALTGTLVPFFQPEDYVKILGGVRTVVVDSHSDLVLISAAQFLSKCGLKEIPTKYETSVFDNISTMYQRLVSSSSWLVYHHAMESVKSFAEVTRYTHIMADCVPDNLLPALEDFLNQVPFKNKDLSLQQDLTTFQIQLLQTQLDEMQSLREVPDKTVIPSDASKFESGLSGDSIDCQQRKPSEPEAKRMKCEDADDVSKGSAKSPVERNKGDEHYWQALNSMKTNLGTIISLRKIHRPSDGVLKELKTFQATLNGFLAQTS